MKVCRRDTGEKYTPFNHCGMKTQVIFNPETGSKNANVTLSTIPRGTGSADEVREHSDQIFHIIKGEMKIGANGQCWKCFTRETVSWWKPAMSTP